jgi:Na+/alanine symporter
LPLVGVGIHFTIRTRFIQTMSSGKIARIMCAGNRRLPASALWPRSCSALQCARVRAISSALRARFPSADLAHCSGCGSPQALVPTSLDHFIKIVMCACYGLFAFATLLGMISFAEISANFISRSQHFITGIRVAGSLVFVPFGAQTVLAGLELPNLWALSELMNIIMVLLNVPIVLVGQGLVYKALEHYRATRGGVFVSEQIGLRTGYWTESQDRARTLDHSEAALTDRVGS